ncbi:MAG: periplasmic heavy metal sensor [Pseudomonadota bacterium]
MKSFPWRTALFISLAFNLIIISGAIGAYAAGARIERPSAGGDAAVSSFPGPRAFMQALPPQARREVRRDLVRTFFTAHAEREEARNARIALFQAARAEPYDPQRVAAAFARVRAADAAVAARFQDSVAQSLARMDAEQRHAALDALAQQAGGQRLQNAVSGQQ